MIEGLMELISISKRDEWLTGKDFKCIYKNFSKKFVKEFYNFLNVNHLLKLKINKELNECNTGDTVSTVIKKVNNNLLLPCELIDIIFRYADDIKTILPFKKYMSNTTRYILREINLRNEIEWFGADNKILVMKLMIEKDIIINWNDINKCWCHGYGDCYRYTNENGETKETKESCI